MDIRRLDVRRIGSRGNCDRLTNPLIPPRNFFESVDLLTAKPVSKGNKPFDKKSRMGEIEMKSFFGIAVLTLGLVFAAGTASAQMNGGNPMVGGAAMYKTKNIVENAVNSADHTTLVAAVQAAGLVDTLKSKGPFTVFAPVNGAFAALPAGTVETLLKPANKGMLTKILTYHVVAGNMDSKALAKAIKKGKGKAVLTTVAGGKLTAMMEGKDVIITDEKGGRSTVTIADVRQSNGVIHVIDSVLMPN
jgi:uncharacterized surface protein with fasciclin (FAS1) repeats